MIIIIIMIRIILVLVIVVLLVIVMIVIVVVILPPQVCLYRPPFDRLACRAEPRGESAAALFTNYILLNCIHVYRPTITNVKLTNVYMPTIITYYANYARRCLLICRPIIIA